MGELDRLGLGDVDPAAHGQRRAAGPRFRPGAGAALARWIAARVRIGGGPRPSWTTGCARTALTPGRGHCRRPRRSTWSGRRAGTRGRLRVDGGRREVRCARLVVADGVRSPLGRVLGRAVAPRHGLRRRRPRVPRLRARRQLDLLPPRAARAGRRAAVGLRLDLPAGRRAGEPRRRDAGHRETAGERLAAAAAGVLRRAAPRGVAARDRDLRLPTSALLPMGGAVSGVAGPNWALIGDAAACVNPLNGEGIDYGLETGRLRGRPAGRPGRPGSRLARAAPQPLRAGVLHRPSAGRADHGARAAGPAGPDRDALPVADDRRAAGDGQPGHRGGPRPGGPGLAARRPGQPSRDTRPPFA